MVTVSQARIYIFLKRSIPTSGGQFNLTGIKKVPTPFVMKVHLLPVSLMRPEEPLYFMEQGIMYYNYYNSEHLEFIISLSLFIFQAETVNINFC